MAGLQYYFFPTDFFYPRPPSSSSKLNANGDSSRTSTTTTGTKRPLVSGEALKGDIVEEYHHHHDHHIILKHKAPRCYQEMHKNKIPPQASVSTSLDLSPCQIKAHEDMRSKSIRNLAQQYWNFSG